MLEVILITSLLRHISLMRMMGMQEKRSDMKLVLQEAKTTVAIGGLEQGSMQQQTSVAH